jgi:hypothetical protein
VSFTPATGTAGTVDVGAGAWADAGLAQGQGQSPFAAGAADIDAVGIGVDGGSGVAPPVQAAMTRVAVAAASIRRTGNRFGI